MFDSPKVSLEFSPLAGRIVEYGRGYRECDSGPSAANSVAGAKTVQQQVEGKDGARPLGLRCRKPRQANNRACYCTSVAQRLTVSLCAGMEVADEVEALKSEIKSLKAKIENHNAGPSPNEKLLLTWEERLTALEQRLTTLTAST